MVHAVGSFRAANNIRRQRPDAEIYLPNLIAIGEAKD